MTPTPFRRLKSGGVWVAAALFLWMGSGVSSLAQQVPGSVEPGAVQKNSTETQKYYGLQKELEQNKKPSLPQDSVNNQAKAKAQQAPLGAGQKFLLKKVEMNPSRILTASEEAKITGQYEGKEVGIQDLFALVEQINHLYKEKGFVAARAVLPPQNVSSGTVTVQLIEGIVEKIVVKGNEHTKASYFTRRISLKQGDLVQVNKLQKDLEYFNLTNDTKMRATLRPGEKFGTTEVDLDVQPVTNTDTSFFFDDAGPDLVGRERLGLTATDQSLFGYRDPLSIGAYWANGTLAGYAFYSVPVTARGLRLGGGVSYDTIRVRSGPLQKLGIRGNFYDVSLRLSQPLVVRRKFIFTGFLMPHYLRSTLSSSGFPISHVIVRSLQLGGDFHAYDNHGFWYSMNTVTTGYHSLGGSTFFAKYDGSLTRLETMPHGWLGIVRATGQVKASGSGTLPPSEQFQIGGLSTVRGYPQADLIGDSGYALSGELDAPLPLGEKEFHGTPWSQRLKIAFFIDHGGIRQGTKNEFITGAGSGFVINLSKYLSTRLNVAAPLENRASIHHVAFQFYVQSSPPLAKIFGRH